MVASPVTLPPAHCASRSGEVRIHDVGGEALSGGPTREDDRLQASSGRWCRARHAERACITDDLLALLEKLIAGPPVKLS